MWRAEMRAGGSALLLEGDAGGAVSAAVTTGAPLADALAEAGGTSYSAASIFRGCGALQAASAARRAAEARARTVRLISARWRR
jgi:hypothetical protein